MKITVFNGEKKKHRAGGGQGVKLQKVQQKETGQKEEAEKNQYDMTIN